MITPKRAFGDKGEEAAADYLRRRGYRILARQVRMGRWGEIDIVAADGAMIVFVEVKTRRTDQFGSPEESLTKHKCRALSRAIEAYRISRGLGNAPYRFDFVAVDGTTGITRIRQHENVPLE